MISLHLPVWLVLCGALPSFVFTWLALAVSLNDLLSRPASQLSSGRRMLWLVLIALLNVLAFLPYWLFVARFPRERK